MDPVTFASAVANLFFNEAFKEGGRALGKAASESIAQLRKIVREKFKASKKEGVLSDVEENPNDLANFISELKKELSKDNDFASQLKELVSTIESECDIFPVTENVKKVANVNIGYIQTKGNISNVGNVNQSH